MKKILHLLLLIPILNFGQCFDCAKNMGGWNGDSPAGIVKSTDGIYLLKNSGNFNMYAGLDKYDFNCNLIWSKQFDRFNLYIKDLTYDSDGNIYVLYAWTISSNTGYGPFIIEGLPMNPGLNLYKFDPNGNFIWHRFLGYGDLYNNLNKIYYYNNLLYVVSSHYGEINIDNQYSYNFPYTNDNTRPYICKIDLQSNIQEVNTYGTGSESYTSCEMDSSGNIYLSSFYHHSPMHSELYKIDSSLNLVWTKQISTGTNSCYRVTQMHYNPDNNKLYTWGIFNRTVNVSNNIFTIDGPNGIFQSLLGEFDVTNGNLNRIKRIDNSSSSIVPGIGGYYRGNNAFMTNKDNELYVFTSFKGELNFPNATINSNTYYFGEYHSEELLLFKVDLTNFNSEFILKSYGLPNLNYEVRDFAGPILFDDDNLYITAAFSSKPMLFNGTTINNNSGNNGSDIMLYKFNTNSISSVGDFTVTNTCLNTLTSFNLIGTFDSILWNFGDPTSTNNSATINNPQHQFSGPGNYHVTVTVTCGTNTQTVEKDIFITNTPTVNLINPIVQCETVHGSGVSFEFNTSTINSQLIGNQLDTTVEYRSSNGFLLSSPLPNPYTNINIGGDVITARVFYNNNPTCYVETDIHFNTQPKSASPTSLSPQSFCIQQNATISDIVITGQNIKWYDSETGGNLLSSSTILVDGVTYYASQTLNSCESSRIPITIEIHETPAPTGNNQSFCTIQNPTLNDITINGSSIKWYSDNISTVELPQTTSLTDNTTYYATQTLNGCESTTRLPITISIISTLNANDYSTIICDSGNDDIEITNLTSFNDFLISSVTNNTFTYYKSLNGAENQISNEQLNSNHSIQSGLNTIFVRIDSSNGCHQIVQLQLTLVNVPEISILDEVILCERSIVTVNAGSGFNSYNWSNNDTTQSIVINQAGNYWVTVTKHYNSTVCSSTKNFTVILSNKPTITSISTIDWTDSENNITVNVTGLGDYEYSIDGINFQDSNVFSGLSNGVYTVTVKDKKECGITSKQVYLLNYPKFFTPNGDGNNDTWKVKFSQFEENFVTQIFDRYGKLIKVLNNHESWDGTYNGKQLPSDDYWFQIIRNDGRVHKGHFAMLR
jgi:gliding motility-associated-like protein